MDVLRFKLSGTSAFFKKPDVNTYHNFTYGQIHKAALLGLFGAVVGYRGYGFAQLDNKKKQPDITFESDELLPEYYRHLNQLKVSIEPLVEEGYFHKKIQIFNNTTGFASKEEGGIWNVKEQWLEHPAWYIYLLLVDEESRKVAESIMTNRCVYVPYLGKNDHFADITEQALFKAEASEEVSGSSFLFSSLFEKSKTRFALLEEDEEDEEDDNEEEQTEAVFKYEENLPIGLYCETGLYQMQRFCYTNIPVQSYSGPYYRLGEKVIAFY